MKYLDYLTTHEWAALPPALKATIDREEYAERRAIALGLKPEEKQALPPALAAAFLAATADKEAGPQGAVIGKRRSDRRPWLLAAAGWVLFAVAAATLLLRSPAENVVYRVLATEVPEPRVVIERDTLIEESVRTLVRYQTVRDTVYVEQPVYLAVQDTVYLPAPSTPAPVISGSRSLAGRQAITRLLFTTE